MESVIIIATYPSRFLRSSVDSVLSQTLCREDYEIIVVKNYKEKETDDFLRSHNIINIYTEKTQLGKKIALGVRHASGEVISFLDYDDVFLPSKLEHVEKAFSSLEELIYYHNNFKIISNTTEVGDTQGLKFQSVKFYFNGTQYGKISRKLRILRPDFNNSCISVRRRVILKFIELIEKIEISLDQALFYLCLQLGQGILIDGTVLTLYRIHESNSSLPDSKWSRTDKSEIARIVNYEKKRLSDLNSLILLNRSSLLDYVLSDIALIKISQCLRSTEEYPPVQISYTEYIYYIRGGRIIRRFIGALVCLLRLKSKTFNNLYLRFIMK